MHLNPEANVKVLQLETASRLSAKPKLHSLWESCSALESVSSIESL